MIEFSMQHNYHSLKFFICEAAMGNLNVIDINDCTDGVSIRSKLLETMASMEG